jgi:hypothetical protein
MASASDAFSVGQNRCRGSLRNGGECCGHLCRRSPPRWLKIDLPAATTRTRAIGLRASLVRLIFRRRCVLRLAAIG